MGQYEVQTLHMRCRVGWNDDASVCGSFKDTSVKPSESDNLASVVFGILYRL